MIIGVGIDIVNIDRIANLLLKFGDKFERKTFTKGEIERANRFKDDDKMQLKAKYYAKRFAAKEAFSKAIGLGIGRGVDFLDIEITNNANGKPEIALSDKAQNFVKAHFKISQFKIDLSLSDEPPIAQAITILSVLAS
ncbi:MAG: holo-ACP synthase [Proteobacteria bacterium]|nr:holo-ACP synthase [Pseudomonadota bacterium]